jgi:ribosomal protein S18 acetylase RimI-like enzyme
VTPAPAPEGSGRGVNIEAVLTADPALLAALARLVPQVSSSAPAPTAYEVEGIVESPATTLFVARDDDGHIVGSLTLAVFRVPTGVRAWIEDVVVDTSVRGAGIGSALVNHAVEAARREQARTVDLTSRPDRVEANRLYQRLGFEKRETNVYRYSLER